MRSYSQDLRDKLINSYNKHGYGNAVLAAYDSLIRMNITYKERAQVQRKIAEKP